MLLGFAKVYFTSGMAEFCVCCDNFTILDSNNAVFNDA